ncbi:MAG: beta-CASP ribonuclease aCPSF1 [archaeon]|jgi:KH/beta-lactamase-domain protein|nr:beta-CASP ribonuclease aCPSF1 [archaeon]MDD2477941.1 beta-CASP ribonuclease aCPSF1 [Candidatus ainarchaeum sp.]MDD3084837.1 beta-CASP ribonuclease aCPSF1 [Candidatus ainarchaeum sp.]MDD4221245.1 beta-CASP ribonuclease aCPSF1 [Candidatus ainarchaeum sp.]MDD4662752.1 beta-CASP ribonuclease aCPSF1 [Candidatus ainarchaeum sp.]
MDLFEDIKKQISTILTEKKVNFTKIEAEGSEIAVYTTNPIEFFENKSIVGHLAETFKKRINVRTEKSALMDPAEANEILKKIIPKDAGVKSIFFDAVFSEVVIEADKPGVVIGKLGDVSKSIIRDTKWIPKILRAPTENSEILKKVRGYVLKNSLERKQFLKDVAQKIYSPPVSNKDWVRVTALGGFREVGRSSILLETPDTKILLDCGINAADKNEETPFLGVLRFPLDELDAVVITHAHIDHVGFLPYLFKAGYRGPVYCTEPTRDLMALLLFDAITVAEKSNREPLYGDEDVKETIKHCIIKNFREVTDIAPGIRLTFHGTSHILGSASLHLHIGEGKQNLVYSGDIKYGFTRLFNTMDINYPRVETLILESTYGGKPQMPSRTKSEDDLIEIINQTVEKGGITLIPVFSVGRAQEVMIVLEEYYRRGKLKTDKVFIDGMTREASAIHTVYPEYLKQNIKTRILQNNSPFQSKIFLTVDFEENSRENVINTPGSIILASSGMLTGGPSLGYFNLLADNPNNTMLFVGYQAKNSLGYKVQRGLKSMPITENNGKTKMLNINMRLETVDAFSGHAYRQEVLNFLTHLNPKPKLILVNHGDSCQEFSKFVNKKFHINTVAIQNLESVRLR